MSGPEKPKVIGEEWSDERVKSFLFLSPVDARINPDHHVLIKAYEAMRAEDFERFLGFFVAAGRDINARDEHGETMLDHVSRHRRMTAYAEALRKAGAKKAAEVEA
ncbi:PA4642 family protein [Marinobacter bryozoorum]|uniref:PA4642 family protein n=1 Tax=Marinobacter bryozoorum TaxID=256324 RepID=UPI002003F940|nr:PA4642 family protein [Marinobacter bryozoorum]MCK7543618.1 PA4642 family protein [Marinobacter bryozoorum]